MLIWSIPESVETEKNIEAESAGADDVAGDRSVESLESARETEELKSIYGDFTE